MSVKKKKRFTINLDDKIILTDFWNKCTVEERTNIVAAIGNIIHIINKAFGRFICHRQQMEFGLKKILFVLKENDGKEVDLHWKSLADAVMIRFYNYVPKPTDYRDEKEMEYTINTRGNKLTDGILNGGTMEELFGK